MIVSALYLTISNICIIYIRADPPMKRHGDLDRDPGSKSEGEDDSQHGGGVGSMSMGGGCGSGSGGGGGTLPSKKSLGKTPNHLTLR